MNTHGTDRSHEPVVWVRCEDSTRLAALADISSTLNAEGFAVTFLVTLGRPTADLPAHPQGGRAISAFLDKHRPIMAICIGGTINAETLRSCEAQNVPFITVEAQPDTLREMTGGWFRTRARPALANLLAGFAIDAVHADALRLLGAPPDQVFALGPLEPGATILPCHEGTRRDISETLINRPVWSARSVTVEEVAILIPAHRHAARRSHRLLLCVTRAPGQDAAAITNLFQQAGFATTLRSTAPLPEESCQVYIIDNDDEDGLWLRLAQTTFAGGSLTTGARHDPFEAAALGSVVVHGLQITPYDKRFRRLMRAGASLGIADPAKLGPAIESLLSPDRAAQMAVAGWDVTSSGADISNRIAALIQQRLDQVGG